MLRNKNLTPVDVMALAGHSDIETTLHYLVPAGGVVYQIAVNQEFGA
jgi:hypothetical protein